MWAMNTGTAEAPRPAPSEDDLPAWGGPGPRAIALAGFAMLFAAGLLLWAKYGVTIFTDGAAALWACL